MTRSRANAPESAEEFASILSGGHRYPEDELLEFALACAVGGDEPLPVASPSTADPDDAPPQPDTPPVARATETHVPDVIRRVLDSEDGKELLAVAEFMDLARTRPRDVLFGIPGVGAIKCRVSWTSCEPCDLVRAKDEMLFIKIRSSAMVFTPQPGAVLTLSFPGHNGSLRVVCLAEPQHLYPGVDLLCFMPHTPGMEKTGSLTEGAPSVVSGRPSNDVSDTGEPVVKGEQAVKAAMLASVGFDVPRQ